MAELITRPLQLQLLTELSHAYPNPVDAEQLCNERNERDVNVNLYYLYEHGLVDALVAETFQQGKSVVTATLTASGIDFLADDGGLSAILGVVTVKLHDDTIRDLLLARVDSAPDLDEPAKKKLKDTIKGLPAEALKTFTIEGLKAGLNHLPDIGHWLMTVANTLT